jgi:chloramphenicol 3-O-phosphotransferase
MKLIFIYGGAASGKLTVARELANLTGLPVFHNHLIVDAVAAVFPFGSEQFIRLRESFWLTMFREAAKAQTSIIFTFAPEATVPPDFPARVTTDVGAFGGEVDFVSLTLPREEQERRIANASRGEFGKLRSLELLRQLKDQFTAAEAAMPNPALTIDTSAVAPNEAAQQIAATLHLSR